ncbi:MAG: tripartite tricarboxylate transporter substrate binding protein [Alcaligenaceae bacterium]
MTNKHRVMQWWRGLRLACAMLALSLSCVAPVGAQQVTLPKFIRLIVPFSPGGSNDVYARALAQKLAGKVSASVVVENKPGAGGSIGSDLVARAEPDGSTLLLISTSFATNAAVRNNLPFDPITSFKPVALVAKGAMVLIVGNKTPFTDIAQLIAATKLSNNAVNYSSAGMGSIGQMSVEHFKAMSDTQALHVPYQGINGAVANMIGGNIDYMITTLASVGGQLQANLVRPIGVTSLERSKFFPGVPAIAETLPGYEVDVWWVVFAPAKTASPVIDALNAAIRSVSTEPEMQALFAKEGAESTNFSPAQTADYVKQEVERWKQVARTGRIQVN